MKLLAPRQMLPDETKQVMLQLEPVVAANEDTSAAPVPVPVPALGHMDVETSGEAIPHGTEVEATIRVAEPAAFVLREGEEVTQSVIWQGKKERLEWYVKSRATAKPGGYVGAVIVTVKWGKHSK